MARFFRYDTGAAQALRPAERTPEGWLRLDGRTARVGILEYPTPDGKVRRELVLPEVLFDKGSMDSARMVPVCNTHPSRLLDARSARQHQVGSVGELLREDDGFLSVPLMVTDADLVAAMESGRQVQLSWGYECELDPPDPALFEKWGEHDNIQRDRRYNHLAVVEAARAGAGARARLDAAGHARLTFEGASAPIDIATQQNHGEGHMPAQVRFDGITLEISDANAQAIQQAVDKMRTDSASRVDGLMKRIDSLEKLVGIVKGNAVRLLSWGKGLAARIDAVKTRMVPCDECGGTGKVTAADGAMTKCDWCDGAGKFSFHDAVKSMPEPEGSDMPHPEDDLTESGEPPMEEDALETESESEHEEAKAANPQHKDAAKKRRDARRVLQQRRRDAMDRIASRRATARAALVIEAKPHLDAAAKVDSMDDLAIRKAVVTKLAPHVKLDGLDASAVGLLYQAEIGRLGSPARPSASDEVRGGVMPAGGRADSGGVRTLEADIEKARKDAAEKKANAYKTPGQQPS